MSIIIESDMRTEAQRVLQDWGMLMTEEIQSSDLRFDLNKPFLVASLKFSGLLRGSYLAVCQVPLAEILATNLLGDPEEARQPDVALDAVKEMVNVLSGNMLTHCYGSDTAFELTAPFGEERTFEGVKQLLSTPLVSFRADGEPLAICFLPDEVPDGH